MHHFCGKAAEVDGVPVMATRGGLHAQWGEHSTSMSSSSFFPACLEVGGAGPCAADQR